MTQPDPTMTKLDTALSACSTGININDHLVANHEAIAARRQAWRGKVEDFWNITAETFRAAGIVNKYGKPLNGHALRKAWDRTLVKRPERTAPADIRQPAAARDKEPAPDVVSEFHPTRKL